MATAEKFLADGNYSWNAGIFVFTAGHYLAELTEHQPEMASLIAISAKRGTREAEIFHPDAVAFEAIKGNSIDYAVMERTSKAAVVPVPMQWSDIGDWEALSKLRGDALNEGHDLINCDNVFVDSDGPRVSAVGLTDVVIVINDGEVLVTSALGAQSVGKLPGANGG